MAYDEQLAGRVRAVLAESRAAAAEPVEKAMFGGLAFMLAGNMAVGVMTDALLVRLSPDDVDAALDDTAVRPFDMGRGPSRGWVLVDPPGTTAEADLRRWVQRGSDYALSLPPK